MFKNNKFTGFFWVVAMVSLHGNAMRLGNGVGNPNLVINLNNVQAAPARVGPNHFQNAIRYVRNNPYTVSGLLLAAAAGSYYGYKSLTDKHYAVFGNQPAIPVHSYKNVCLNKDGLILLKKEGIKTCQKDKAFIESMSVTKENYKGSINIVIGGHSTVLTRNKFDELSLTGSLGGISGKDMDGQSFSLSILDGTHELYAEKNGVEENVFSGKFTLDELEKFNFRPSFSNRDLNFEY